MAESAIASEELLQARLEQINDEKRGLARMINDAKDGKSSTALSSLQRIEDKLLIDELNIQTQLAKFSAKRARVISSDGVLATSAVLNSNGKSNSSSIGNGPLQLTLSRFFSARSRDGHVYKLKGPEVIASNSDLCCRACEKCFKSVEGLREHQRHCAKILQQQITSSASVAIKEVTQERTKIFLSQPRTLSVNDEESDDDSDATTTPQDLVVVERRRGQSFRLRYTKRMKYRVALLVDALLKEGVESAEAKVVELTGLPATNVHNWHKALKNLERELYMMRGTKGRGHAAMIRWNTAKRGGKGAMFAAAEEVIFGKYESARAKGIRVGPTLLKTWMLRAVRALYTSTRASLFTASSGWLQRFLIRFDLRPRRATNRKEKSVMDRLPKVQRWHKRWQYFISHGGSNHVSFGRYLPQNVLNSDQVPVRASEMSDVTYEKRGADTVRIAQQKGSDKRMATLQVCVSLDGSATNRKPQPKIAIIFKGKGNISAAERAAYDPRVDVYFQPKAWMDSGLFVEWTNRTLKPFVENLPAGPKAMVLDNLRAQTNEESATALRAIGVDRRLLPEGTTDMIQPVDQNVGVHIKRLLGEKLNERLTEDGDFQERWLGVNGTFTAKERRVLLTQLLGEAWEEFCDEKDFFALGMSTGCVMTKLGVDRAAGDFAQHPIRIKGVPSYAFEHVPMGDPAPVLTDEDSDVLEEVTGSIDTLAAAESLSAAAVATGRGSSCESELVDIHLYGIDDIAAQSFNESEEIVEDNEEADARLDDTDINTGVEPPTCPSGYSYECRPAALPPLSTWINREIHWRAEMPNGEELLWIKTVIIGGPADPQQALQGVTMRLKCDHRQDPGTPKCFRGKISSVVQVALTPENYGQKWFLLRKD
jgi:hypothetical protein